MEIFLAKPYKTNGFSSSNMTKETEKLEKLKKRKKLWAPSGPPPVPSPYVLKGLIEKQY